jgi:hypothetical protein
VTWMISESFSMIVIWRNCIQCYSNIRCKIMFTAVLLMVGLLHWLKLTMHPVLHHLQFISIGFVHLFVSK